MKYFSRIILIGSLFFVFQAWAGNEPDTLKFPHQKHITEANLECTDCHTVAAPEAGGSVSTPKMESCKQCHDEAFTAKNCALCHTNSNQAKAYVSVLTPRNFAHATHVSKQNLKCSFCHQPSPDSPRLILFPKMAVCQTCHNDKVAPANCKVCHQDPDKARPVSHRRSDWEGRLHGRDARFAKVKCESCHAQTYCDRCHKGRDERVIHRPDYQFTHGIDARRQDKNCTVCHESERFCASCHEGRK